MNILKLTKSMYILKTGKTKGFTECADFKMKANKIHKQLNSVKYKDLYWHLVGRK